MHILTFHLAAQSPFINWTFCSLARRLVGFVSLKKKKETLQESFFCFHQALGMRCTMHLQSPNPAFPSSHILARLQPGLTKLQAASPPSTCPYWRQQSHLLIRLSERSDEKASFSVAYKFAKGELIRPQFSWQIHQPD